VGTLDLTGTVSGGEIDASGGSVTLDDVSLSESILGGTGTIETAAGNTDSTLDDVEIGNGTIVTVSVGTLDLTGTIANGGTLTAVTGGTIDLENADIQGGTLSTSGTGTIATQGTGDNTLDGTTNTVTIGSGTTLTVNNGTTLDLTGTIANGGTLTAATGGTIDLENADIQGGTLSTSGTGTIATQGTGDNTLDGTTNTVTIGSGTTLTVNNGTTLDLTGTIANGGTLTAVTGGTIDLENADIQGGTLSGAGTIATVGGGSTLDGSVNAVTIDTGTTVTVSAGTTLTLLGTIDDQGTINVDTVGPATKLQISGSVVLQGGGKVTLDTSSDALLSNGAAATLTNYDTISGIGTIGDAHLTLINDGTIEAVGGTLEIATDVSGTGSLEVGDHSTLKLDGSDSETITFLSGTGPGTHGGTLILNDLTPSGDNHTVNAVSSTPGSFLITGTGNVTAATGDGIDFNASGGVSGNAAPVSITTSGAITGAVKGILVTQTGRGDITITSSGNVVGNAGTGISAIIQGTAGFGSILVNGSGDVTGTGASSDGILAEILHATDNGNVTVSQTGNVSGGQDGIVAVIGTSANGGGTGNIVVTTGANAAITGTSRLGISAVTFGTGSISVAMASSGDVITSGASGILAVNQATTILAAANSTISVTAHGEIDSGSNNNPNGSAPSAIDAGYLPGGSKTPNGSVSGNVSVTSDAVITAAAGDGINAFTWGTGNVTVQTNAGSSITAVADGIKGTAHDGGNVSITNVGSVTAGIGIDALSTGSGKITITNSGDVSGDGTVSNPVILINQDATGTATVTNQSGGKIDAGSASGLAISSSTGTVTVDNFGTIIGDVSIDAAFTNESGGIWDISGTNTLNGTGSTLKNLGTINVEGSSSFATNGTLAISNSGTIDVQAGTLTLSAQTITNSINAVPGTVDVELNTTLALSGSTITGGSLNVYGTLNSTGTSFITGTAITDAGTIEATGGTLTIDPGSFTNTSLLLAHGSGTTLVISGETITNTNGTVQVDLGAVLDLATSVVNDGTFTNSGSVDSTGVSTINAATFTNTGTVEVVSGTLTVDSAVSGTGGSFQIDNGARLVLATDSDGGDPISFGTNASPAANAVLQIDQGPNFTDVVSNLAVSDAFDLKNITGSNVTVTYLKTNALDRLTVTDGAHTDVINLSGDYTGGIFSTHSDVGGGTTVALQGYVTINGTAQEGQTLSAQISDSLLGNGSVTYQWLRDGSIIQNATGANYVVTEADEGHALSVKVSFTDTAGNFETGVSAATNPVVSDASITAAGSVNTTKNTNTPITGIVVSDPDLIGTTTLTLSVNNGTLTVPNNVSGGVTNVTGSGTGSVTLTGTLSQINTTLAAVNGVVYLTTNNNGGILTMTVPDDNGGKSAIVSEAITVGGAVTFGSGTSTITGNISGSATFDITNSGTLNVTGNISGGETFDISQGATLNISGNVTGGATFDVTDQNQGTINISGNITGAGTYTLQNSSHMTITGNITGTENFFIQNNAYLKVVSAVTGTGGSFSVANSATLEFGSSDSWNVTFTGNSSGAPLLLDHSLPVNGIQQFTGEIFGVTSSADVDLRDLPFSAAQIQSIDTTSVPGTTIVTLLDTANQQTVVLHFDGTHTSWSILTDGNGATPGTLLHDPATDTGTVAIDSGTTLEITAPSAATIDFANANGTTGNLVLDDSQDFTGQISGFTGSGTIATSDAIDLKDINFGNLTTETYTENTAGTGGTLTVSDGTHTANIDFVGNYQLANFKFSSDGSGGTLIIDPPVVSGQIGTAPGHDGDREADGTEHDGPHANTGAIHGVATDFVQEFTGAEKAELDDLLDAHGNQLQQIQQVVGTEGSGQHPPVDLAQLQQLIQDVTGGHNPLVNSGEEVHVDAIDPHHGFIIHT
jgi:hypothetical protein